MFADRAGATLAERIVKDRVVDALEQRESHAKGSAAGYPERVVSHQFDARKRLVGILARSAERHVPQREIDLAFAAIAENHCATRTSAVRARATSVRRRTALPGRVLLEKLSK